jgi:hypothetical protein
MYASGVCVRAVKGLALPRASHPGEIALSGSRHLRSTLAVAPVLFAHAVVTVAKNPYIRYRYIVLRRAHVCESR